MIYVAGFIIAFSLLQLLVAFVNILFAEKLPRGGSDISAHSVSVLIPARNEERNIQNLLNDLIRIKDNWLEIMVLDDQSADRTADVVHDFAARHERIRCIQSNQLPEGWLGKNHACHQLALNAAGDYLLFLDADVRVYEGLIDGGLRYMLDKKTDLLSIFPVQEMRSVAEKITVPNIHFILLTLLPLPLVRLLRFPSMAAANGQFMLFNKETYHAFLPHERFRKSRAEDIEIARFYKMRKKNVSCLTGMRQVRCRMYGSLPEAVEGFSKNVAYFFGNSYLWAVVFWLITTLGFIPVLMAGKTYMLVLYVFITVLTRVFFSLAAKQNVFENLVFAIPQQITLGLFICKSIINKTKNQFKWKGRNI